MKRIVYYWEGEKFHRSGKFLARNNKRALKKMPKDAVLLYRESNTSDWSLKIVWKRK